MTATRWILVAIGIVVFVVPLGSSLVSEVISPAQPHFPPPVENQAVYDKANVLSSSEEAALEDRIDALEARSGAEMAIYLQVKPGQTFDSNLALAESLLNEWGIDRRRGSTTGSWILVSLDQPGAWRHQHVRGWRLKYVGVDRRRGAQ